MESLKQQFDFPSPVIQAQVSCRLVVRLVDVHVLLTSASLRRWCTNSNVGPFLSFVFQTVRSLVAAVLKEKGLNGQITQSSLQVSVNAP